MGRMDWESVVYRADWTGVVILVMREVDGRWDWPLEGGGLVPVCIARSGGDVADPSIRRFVSFPPSWVVFR